MSDIEEAPQQDITIDSAKPDRTGMKLAILFGVLAVLFVATVLLLRTPDTMTFEQAYQATIEGRESETNYLYNGFVFVKVDEHTWKTRIKQEGQTYEIPLRFSPREAEAVPVEGSLNESFNSSKLYITFDPRKENMRYEALAATELTINLATVLHTEPIAACAYNETEACHTRPIVSCQDTDKGVIFLREASEARVELLGNCMVIQGPGEELVKAVDRVLYVWLGIMPAKLDKP